MAARIIRLGTKSIARLPGDYVEAVEYLNRLFSVHNLAQKGIRNGRKGFANASVCLETWDDSDSITAVNAQNI